MPTDFIDALLGVVPGVELLSGEAAIPYCVDWRGRYSGVVLAVVFPIHTSEVAEIVKLCASRRIAIVPQGGNTSLCGGSVPLPEGEQIVLNLSRMNQVRDIDPVNYTITVEAEGFAQTGSPPWAHTIS